MSPLKALHCPDEPWHWTTPTECAACEHPCFGSHEWVNVIWGETFTDEDHYHNDPMTISVTETLGCLRMAYYKRTQDYAESPERMLARVMGTHNHRLPEKHNPEGSEITFAHPLSDGFSLKGTADVSLPGIIRDYKGVDRPTKTLGGGVREDEDGQKLHVNALQLSVYADLKELAGEEEVHTLEIVQVARKAIKAHESYRVPQALGWAISRAEALISVLNGDLLLSSLKFEGIRIKYYRVNQCSFCPFKVQCKQECEEK